MEITTIGIDVAKDVFGVHGVDGRGQVTMRKRLVRKHLLEFMSKLPACLVGLEACTTEQRRSTIDWPVEHGALGTAAARGSPQPFRTAGCGPACLVVWQGSGGAPLPPMPTHRCTFTPSN